MKGKYFIGNISGLHISDFSPNASILRQQSGCQLRHARPMTLTADSISSLDDVVHATIKECRTFSWEDRARANLLVPLFILFCS